MTTYWNRLWFGPISGLVLLAGIVAIGAISPGYSHVSQTVSELGEVGSPGRLLFAGVLCVVAIALLVFAQAVAKSVITLGHSKIPAYFLVAMAMSTAGVGVFAFPMPLHNIFGLSETIGYQTPLFAAIACGSDPRLRKTKTFSIIMYVVVLLVIGVNLLALVRPAEIWALIKPVFGVVQRALFASWFVWCAGYAMLLMQAVRPHELAGGKLGSA